MASAAIQIELLAKGLPPSRDNSKRAEAWRAASSGFRLNNDSLALRTSFYNGASTIAVSETGGSGGGRISMKVASKGAYICRDCGYIYNERTAFEKLSNDYSCPVCAAPKRRFKPYDVPVARNANDQSVRKARKADMKQADAALGSALPVGIAIGVAALLGTFLYLNSTL